MAWRSTLCVCLGALFGEGWAVRTNEGWAGRANRGQHSPTHLARLAAVGDDYDAWHRAVMANAGETALAGLGDFPDTVDSENASFVELEAASSTTEPDGWPASLRAKFDTKMTQVGSGTYGTVYVTRIRCDKSFVAIKVLKVKESDAVGEAALLKMFTPSPHFIAYFDMASTRGPGTRHFIVMEAATGGAMTAIINGNTPTTIATRRRLLFESLKGIAYMHDLGIVHRDLKPDNIFLSVTCGGAEPCFAKVGDLGLACKLRESKAPGVPICQDIGGTPVFLAPEVFRTGTIDPKNDVWALGLILYFLEFGQLPKPLEDAETIPQLRARVTDFDISKDSKFKKSSSRMQGIFKAMLANDLSKRASAQAALVMADFFREEGGKYEPSVAKLHPCYHEQQLQPKIAPVTANRPEPRRTEKPAMPVNTKKHAGIPGRPQIAIPVKAKQKPAKLEAIPGKPVGDIVSFGPMATTFRKPVGDIVSVGQTEKDVQTMSATGARYITLRNVKYSVVLPHVLSDKHVNEEGFVIATREQIVRLKASMYWPRALDRHDHILELNNIPWSRARHQLTKFKEGLYGDSVTIKYKQSRGHRPDISS